MMRVWTQSSPSSNDDGATFALEMSSPNRVSRPLKRKHQKASATDQSNGNSSTKFPRRGMKGEIRAWQKPEELTETVADAVELKSPPRHFKSWSITRYVVTLDQSWGHGSHLIEISICRWIHQQFQAISPESLSSSITNDKVDNVSFPHMRKSSHPKHKNERMHSSVTSTSMSTD